MRQACHARQTSLTLLPVTTEPLASTGTHESRWAGQLFACMQDFAARRTNAVMLILADIDRPEPGRRYPEAGLEFAGHRWRAFYHCHDADVQHPQEHGHFHIFTDTGKQHWAHVAGLSIDRSGQPLQWFAVNRWVTGSPWFAREELLRQLGDRQDRDSSAVGCWLFALLQLYRSTLTELLTRRDEQVRQHALHQERTAVLEDPAIYTLAMLPIELQSMLEKHLLSRADITNDTGQTA